MSSCGDRSTNRLVRITAAECILYFPFIYKTFEIVGTHAPHRITSMHSIRISSVLTVLSFETGVLVRPLLFTLTVTQTIWTPKKVLRTTAFRLSLELGLSITHTRTTILVGEFFCTMVLDAPASTVPSYKASCSTGRYTHLQSNRPLNRSAKHN